MCLHDNCIGDIIHEVTSSRSSCWCIFSTLMGLYFWSQKERCIMDLEAIGFGDCLGKHYDIFGWYWRGDWLHWTRRVVPIQFWFPRRRENSFKRLKLKVMVLLGSLLDAANRLLPGATVATLLMLGALHARRLYEDSKVFLFFSYLSRNQVFFFPLFNHPQHPGSTHSEEFFYTVVGCVVFLWQIEEQKRQGKELEFAPDWKVITSP